MILATCIEASTLPAHDPWRVSGLEAVDTEDADAGVAMGRGRLHTAISLFSWSALVEPNTLPHKGPLSTRPLR